MDDMVMTVNAVIEIMILVFYFNGFLNKKQKKYCTVVVFMAIILNIIKNYAEFPAKYNLILSLINVSFIAFINYSDKKGKILFSVCVYMIVMVVTEIISENMLSEILKIDYGDVPVLKIEHMASLTNIISFMILLYMVIIPSKKIRELPIKYWILVIGLPAFSVYVLLIVDMLIVNTSLPDIKFYSVFLTIGLLYLNIMIFDFFENYSARVRLEESETIIHNNEQNYKILKNNEQNLRVLKHDLNKHINIIKELFRIREFESINTYIEGLDDIVESINSITYTNHLTLDSILNIEAVRANALNIQYLVKSNIQAEINIENIDLTTILYNAVENAIEAAEKAEKKYVVISINSYKDYIDIIIENSYNSILAAADNFKTTKNDTVNHGFGISSIKNAVKKYNGNIQNERDKSINTMKIHLMNS